MFNLQRTFTDKCQLDLSAFLFLDILLFERVHVEKTINFVSAIICCTSQPTQSPRLKFPSCSSLQEAVSVIQKEKDLHYLKDLLTSHVKSIFQCHSCHATPDSLVSSTSDIFIFKSLERDQLIAYPVIIPCDRNDTVDKHCDNCNVASKHIEMIASRQIFLQTPRYLFVSTKYCVVFLCQALMRKVLRIDIDVLLFMWCVVTSFFFSNYKKKIFSRT